VQIVISTKSDMESQDLVFHVTRQTMRGGWRNIIDASSLRSATWMHLGEEETAGVMMWSG